MAALHEFYVKIKHEALQTESLANLEILASFYQDLKSERDSNRQENATRLCRLYESDIGDFCEELLGTEPASKIRRYLLQKSDRELAEQIALEQLEEPDSSTTTTTAACQTTFNFPGLLSAIAVCVPQLMFFESQLKFSNMLVQHLGFGSRHEAWEKKVRFWTHEDFQSAYVELAKRLE